MSYAKNTPTNLHILDFGSQFVKLLANFMVYILENVLY